MNVFLALLLIFIFYYLFCLNDMYHKRINTKNTTEHFTNQETTKLISDINFYFDKRKKILNNFTNFTNIINVLNEKPKKDDFALPVIIKNNVETNETKIKSESPMYVPVNLYVDGSLNIKNVNNDKKLCMGDNCYSEKDILYLIQDLLPYYKYSSKRNNKNDIKKLCFESYESIYEVFELGELEEITIIENLDYTGKLIHLRDILKNYNVHNIDTDVKTDSKKKQIINLIQANVYRTDYHVFSFFEKYPEMISFFKKYYDNFAQKNNFKQRLEHFKNETKKKYENIRTEINKLNDSYTKNYCIGGDDLKILRGEKDVKFETNDTNVKQNTSPWNNFELTQRGIVDEMRKNLSKTPQKKKKNFLGFLRVLPILVG